MNEEQWLDGDCTTEFVDVVDEFDCVIFPNDHIQVPGNIASALRVREHRIVQFEPIVVRCGCDSHCDIVLEIHDNGDLIMVDGLIQEVIKVSLQQVSAVCDAYYPDEEEEWA